MLHHLKIKEEFADAIVRGEKTFEIRINDRGFQKGDLIEFVTVQEDLPFPDCHPIHNRTYEITYVMNGWGLKNGYVVFGIREEDTSIKCQFAEHDADGYLEDRAVSLNDQELMENAEQLRAITNAELLKENEELKRELAHLLLRKSSVTPQRPEGHWLMTGEVDVYYDLHFYECSKCGQTSLENGDYCPNCGCAMIEP